jgi:hypothetical protein
MEMQTSISIVRKYLLNHRSGHTYQLHFKIYFSQCHTPPDYLISKEDIAYLFLYT